VIRGIFGNVIAWNVLRNNGNGGSNQPDGGGVLLASEAPGAAVYDNQVMHNKISGSGLGGTTVHSHTAGQNFTGNVFGWNWIGTNNVGGDYADPHTTGIYIGSVGSLSVVVLGNRIHDNRVGIFKAGPVSLRRRFTRADRQNDERPRSQACSEGFLVAHAVVGPRPKRVIVSMRRS
jgi:hypothetical protein